MRPRENVSQMQQASKGGVGGARGGRGIGPWEEHLSREGREEFSFGGKVQH